MKGYNIRMGKTGLVPKGLTTALGFYGLKDDSAKAAKELSKAVLSHYHGIWSDRCKALYNKESWQIAQDKARMHIEKGIT
jgi:hypothetical protein